jgi:hypothetical protein
MPKGPLRINRGEKISNAIGYVVASAVDEECRHALTPLRRPPMKSLRTLDLKVPFSSASIKAVFDSLSDRRRRHGGQDRDGRG